MQPCVLHIALKYFLLKKNEIKLLCFTHVFITQINKFMHLKKKTFTNFIIIYLRQIFNLKQLFLEAFRFIIFMCTNNFALILASDIQYAQVFSPWGPRQCFMARTLMMASFHKRQFCLVVIRIKK